MKIKVLSGYLVMALCMGSLAYADDAPSAPKNLSVSSESTSYSIKKPSTTLTAAEIAKAASAPKAPLTVPVVTGVTKATVAPRRICGDFQWVGPQARPYQNQNNWWYCSPGYTCDWHGIALECDAKNGVTQDTVIYLDEPACHPESCGTGQNAL